MRRARRVPAMFALAVALVAWGMAPVFIRGLRNAYDPYTQAFIRYFFGTAALCALCMVVFRGEFLGLLRRPGPLMGMACVNIVHQLTWTLGCYRASATLAQLITQTGVVFVILLSFVLFRDERRVIRSPLFLGGTVLSFAGMTALLTGGRGPAGSVDAWTAMLLLVPALCWAVYVVWARRLVMNCHPVPMFAVLSIFITLGTGVIACVFGRPACIMEAGAGITALTLLSGILPIATAHPAFHFAQKYLGSAFCSSSNLFSPALTYLFATIFLDDPPLTPVQWGGAVVLLSGTIMVVRTDSPRSEPVADTP